MRLKYLLSIFALLFVAGFVYLAAHEHNYIVYTETETEALTTKPIPQKLATNNRRMVDMIADDSYLIEKGDSTIFILVGNFAAHHNGAVILADSAVRYSNQSFECFGNVLINQNSTYAYGDRASYNRMNSTVTLYSDLIKIVDGEAVMYTYNCTFDTANEVGRFNKGCYVEKGNNLMESDRGYYYTDTHELIAVDNVEMRDSTYLMTGDSVIFNTQTEDARYFTNTNIWNDKDEYLFANEGSYTKARDLHHLTRDAYILSPEREIWSDSIEYYRTEGHIIGRGNIQMDDTTHKVLGFADYGEWWDDPGNALFTRRPSMINYDPKEVDSLFLSADTLWLYTIAVLPPVEAADTTSTADKAEKESSTEKRDELQSETSPAAADSLRNDANADNIAGKEQKKETEKAAEKSEEKEKSEKKSGDKGDKGDKQDKKSDKRNPVPTEQGERSNEHRRSTGGQKLPDGRTDAKGMEHSEAGHRLADTSALTDTRSRDTLSTTKDSTEIATDTSLIDSIAIDTLPLSAKQLRHLQKMAKRRVRDSLDSIRRHEQDSIRHIKDSLLRIKVDSIIAKRRTQSARIADEEKARIERIKQKSEERTRRKIDKAKARALRRGKEYKGPDYVLDTTTRDTLDAKSQMRDSLDRDSIRDSLAQDSLSTDSLFVDSLPTEPPFPADSTYKMIKAYRRVRMYRSDTQLICDSLVALNTDSIIRLYRDPVMWNESNQITSDSMAIHTANENISKAHFMGDPLMIMEIDTMYYNQVKGKDMTSFFSDGKVYRNDVNGNAQTIYFLQDEGSPDVTGLMYIESAGISFYLSDGEMDKIVYKQNPEYVIYPMSMIPETQVRKLPDFAWHNDKRPLRDSMVGREIRPTRREDASVAAKPRFRITERINYDRRRLVENRMWEDRVDELTPDIIEWRNSRPAYQKKK